MIRWLPLAFRLAQSIESGPPVSQPGAPPGAAGAGPAPGPRHGNATLPARVAQSRKPRRPVGAGGGAELPGGGAELPGGGACPKLPVDPCGPYRALCECL